MKTTKILKLLSFTVIFVSVQLTGQVGFNCDFEDLSTSNSQNQFTTPPPTSQDCTPNGVEDQGDFMYIPDQRWGTITVPVNIWVMQPNINNGIQFEDIDAHREYLIGMIPWANQQIYDFSGWEEGCNPGGGTCSFTNTGADPMIETRVNLVFNSIRFIVDQTGFENNNAGWVNGDTYLVDTYLRDGNGFIPEFDNAINVFYCNDNTVTADGWGPGMWGERNNHVVMNNRFRVYQSTLTNPPSWNIWDEARLFTHELNHCFGVRHTNVGNRHCRDLGYLCNLPRVRNESNHLMHGGFSCERIYFSPLAAGYLRRNFYTTWRSKMASLPECPSYTFTTDYTVGAGEELSYCGDIIVPSGVTLTVIGHIRMFENKSIYVQRGGSLEIDGGHLYSCDSEWNGIIVEGFAGQENNSSNGAGRVIIQNDALIENAKNGVSMNPRNNVEEFYGGYIRAEGSTFRNCRRGVEFMRHGQFGIEDESSFTDMTFEDMRGIGIGVSIWANDGVDFLDCQFRRCEVSGIRAHTSQMDVTSSNDDNIDNFSEMPRGIELLDGGGMIGLGSQITSNRFNCTIGIDISSDDGETPHIIQNNKFSEGYIGVLAAGISNFEINNNNFDSQIYGVILNGSNGDANPIRENEFNNNLRGVISDGDNMQSQLTINCFNNSFQVDVQVANGGLNHEQGSIALEAGNCFSKSTIPEFSNSGVHIDYYIDEDKKDQLVCEDIESSTNLTEVSDPATAENSADNCGSTLEFIPVPEPCKLQWQNPEEVLSLIQAADRRYSELKGKQSSNGQLVELEALTKDLIQALGRSILTPSGEQYEGYGKNFLLNYYSARPEFYARSLVASIHISHGDYNSARQAVIDLYPQSQDESDYKEVQHIYLDYIEPQSELVSGQKIARLRQIGRKQGPINGYARSVYYLVTGERMELEIPDVLEPRSRKTDIEERTIRCHPNPASTELNIAVEEIESRSYNYLISDTNGIMIKQGALYSNENMNLDVSLLPSGLYLLKLSDEQDEEIHLQKVIIVK